MLKLLQYAGVCRSDWSVALISYIGRDPRLSGVEFAAVLDAFDAHDRISSRGATETA